jgi:hypothetical protein
VSTVVSASASTTLGPLRRVLAEIEAGTPTVAGIARRCDLDEDVVRASIDHLVRAGRVESRELSIGCPPSGCGGCASASTEGTPGCGLPTRPTGRRPGLVTLTLSRPARD